MFQGWTDARIDATRPERKTSSVGKLWSQLSGFSWRKPCICVIRSATWLCNPDCLSFGARRSSMVYGEERRAPAADWRQKKIQLPVLALVARNGKAMAWQHPQLHLPSVALGKLKLKLLDQQGTLCVCVQQSMNKSNEQMASKNCMKFQMCSIYLGLATRPTMSLLYHLQSADPIWRRLAVQIAYVHRATRFATTPFCARTEPLFGVNLDLEDCECRGAWRNF